jgi:hypothetical protein
MENSANDRDLMRFDSGKVERVDAEHYSEPRASWRTARSLHQRPVRQFDSFWLNTQVPRTRETSVTLN